MSAQLQKTSSQSVDHHELQYSEPVNLTETLTDAIKHLLGQQG